MILCWSFLLKIHGLRGYGFSFLLNETTLIGEHILYSTAVYHSILTSCAETVRFNIKPFADDYYWAVEMWNFFHTEYASEENMGHNYMIYQM